MARDPVNAKAHEGQMLAFGKDGILKPDQIVTVANYVRALSGLSTRQGYDAAAGSKDLRGELRGYVMATTARATRSSAHRT